MRELVVAISGLSPLQPGRTVARALREAFGTSVRFVGLSYNALEAGNYEPELFERTYLMPFAYADAAHTFDRFEKIKQDGGLDVIYPTFDNELPTLCRLEQRLAAIGVKVVIPTKDMLTRRAKQNLPALAKEADIEIPLTCVCPNLDTVWRRVPELRYPFYVKGPALEAYIVGNGHQLEEHVNRLVRSWGFPVILQSIVTGTELDVIALGDGTGRMVGCVPMKKLELDTNNKAWGGITVDDPELVELAGRVIKALQWRGVLELEVMKDADGTPYLIEINPRVPAWAYLAVAAGQNVIAAALSLVLGDEVRPFEDYAVGAMHLRQCVDVISPIATYESLVMTGQADNRGRAR